jgi:hypothetical protein
MLSTKDLSEALNELARHAGELSRGLDGNGDLPAAALASGYVEAAKLQDRLDKLAAKLNAAGGNGRGQKSGGR